MRDQSETSAEIANSPSLYSKSKDTKISFGLDMKQTTNDGSPPPQETKSNYTWEIKTQSKQSKNNKQSYPLQMTTAGS